MNLTLDRAVRAHGRDRPRHRRDGPVVSLLLGELAGILPDVPVEVDQCPVAGRTLNRAFSGEYRLRIVHGEALSDPSVCGEVATRLVRSKLVASTVALPPFVYLSLEPLVPAAEVTTTVLDEGDGYLDADWGAGSHALLTFSNPNCNKPLHLGHLRNNALGAAVAGLLASRGFRVTRSAVVSDWGRHICQAVVAYRRWGGGRTPDDTGEKSDHFVGRHYAMFHRAAETDPSLHEEVSAFLRAVEGGSPTEIRLHDLVVAWGLAGLARTHERLGSRFDVVFHESSTRHEGRALVEAAATRGLCRRREDRSVYIDLTDRGLGEITLLRGDGTSVVYTQLLGVSVDRWNGTPYDVLIAVNGRQWDDGHRILDGVLHALGYSWTHLEEPLLYGMVRCDNRTLRSRGGIVSTADELLDASVARVARLCAEHGHTVDPGIAETLGTGLVKHCFLWYRPGRDLDFDEAVLWGDIYTGHRLVLNTLRLAELRLRGAGGMASTARSARPPNRTSRTMFLHLDAAPRIVDDAAQRRAPDEVLRFLRRLCADLDGHEHEIHDDSPLWACLALVLRRGLTLVGIDVPDALPWLPPLSISSEEQQKYPRP